MEKGKWVHTHPWLCPVSVSMHSQPDPPSWIRWLLPVGCAQVLPVLIYPMTWHFWEDLYSSNIDLKTWIFPSLLGASSASSWVSLQEAGSFG